MEYGRENSSVYQQSCQQMIRWDFDSVQKFETFKFE
jgi:hypothetical protein